MDRNRTQRAVAVFMMAVLLLGGLGLLIGDLAVADHRQVRGVVTEEGDPTNLLAGVTVTLHDAHGQKDPVNTTTGGDGRYVFTPSPGFYFVTVQLNGFFDNETEVFRFDDTVNVRRDIQMEPMPAAEFTLTVNVEADGVAVEDAFVELFNTTKAQVVGTNTTDANGTATFGVWDGTFELRVEKATFEKEVVDVVIEGANVTVNVSLTGGTQLVGLAEDADGAFVEEGLVAFLYNIDPGTEDAKRLLVATVVGSSYTFFAYPGTFILIVDADGMAANITEIDVPLPGRIDRVLESSPEERVDHEARYVDDDWGQLELWRNLTLNPDSTIPGLPFPDIRHLRLQIHLAFGDGTGNFVAAEEDDFRDWLVEVGPKHVDTAGLFTTNGQYYRSDTGAGDHTAEVAFFPDGSAFVSMRTNYTVVGDPIPLDQPTYFVNVTAPHDTEEEVRVNTTYTLHTPLGYQRALTTTEGNVVVSGWTRGELPIVVDPRLRGEGDPEDVRVEMEVERSEAGVARAMVIGPPNRFTELNVSQENYTALVPTDVNMTFSAEESSDPNTPDGRVNPESNFTWTFQNESIDPIVVYGIRPEVPFQAMGNYTGNLTIEEVGGDVIHRDFTLFVDGLDPEARLENNVTGLGIDAHNATIDIREGQTVRFFGGNSTDMVHPGLAGVVREWRWDFNGDGTVDATGQRVDWTFRDPGEFTVNLTVVDRAGRESENATMTVRVEDVTPPVAAFSILDEDLEEVDALTERVAYVFDGSATTDNFDALEELTFEWDFGDGATATGVNVTHTYDRYGDYDLVLSVTDRAGNEGNATQTVTVEVDPATRPDLEIVTGSLVIDPVSPEESTFFASHSVTIRVNVTNREGRAAAADVQVQFFAFRFGEPPGAPVPIDPAFYLPDGTETDNTLAPGQTKTVEFTWVTGALGNYTLRVNVTDPEEPSVFIGPRNSAEQQIDVREAAWKRPLLIGAVVALIVGIPVALYFRRKVVGKVRERITKR